MANISEFVSAGLDAIHVSGRNAAGHMNGYGQLALTDTGDSSGMRRLKGAVTAPAGVLEPTRIPVRGDDGRIATFQFASSEDNAFIMENSVTDLDFEAFAQGSGTYAFGEWDFGIRGSLGPTFADIMWLFTRASQSQETASLGTAGFEQLLVLSSQAMPLGDDQFAYQGEGGTRYSCIANVARVLPWGDSMAENMTHSNGMFLTWHSQYRMMLHAFVGDGIITDVVVDYTPINVAKTQAWNATDDATVVVSSVTPATKTITLGAAPASGKLVIILYECASF